MNRMLAPARAPRRGTTAPAAAASARAALGRTPALPLLVAAGAVFVWFAARSAGYYPTTWYPGALLALGLLAAALVALPRAAPPRLVAVALAALAAYAAWSYLSIAWAAQKGDAWDGANRSALYAFVFALFALWPLRARAATGLLAGYALAIAALGAVELIGASGARMPEGTYFLDGRFAAPAGYQNADVALWFSAFWPAAALAARRELWPPLRGALAGAAVLLAALALLGQSRGWAYTAPLAAAAFVAVAANRVRAILTLGLIAAAAAIIAGPVLAVYDAAGTARFAGRVDSATRTILIATALVAAATTLVALVDRRIAVPRRHVRAAGAALLIAAALAAAGALGAWVAADGSPASAIARTWRHFKHGRSPRGGGSRFVQVGSNRYDFWRVAVEQFASHPVAGIGADNFGEAYLAHRRSYEEPRYPHSIELRTLSQTGVVGALLLGTAVACALVASLRARRRRQGIGAATAAGALGAFAYWALHGSVDWLWEFPGLGAPAFALLGIAAALVPRPAALAPRRERHAGVSVPRRPGRERATRERPAARVSAARPLRSARGRAIAIAAPLTVAAAALTLSLAAPWASRAESASALDAWPDRPQLALHRLDRAASLDPLSPDPRLLAGSIAIQLLDYRLAERYFRDALTRERGNEYARLELGLLLARRGSPAARTELERAVALDPRDEIPAGALAAVRRGRRPSIAAVNRALARRSIARAR